VWWEEEQPRYAKLGCGMKVEAVVLRAQVALADGTPVWVEHDADSFALVGGASRLGAGSGGGEQLGKERVFLTKSFVGDDGDFTVAARSPGPEFRSRGTCAVPL